MFVGCADDHFGHVYRFLNIKTKRIIMSRDARWLNMIHCLLCGIPIAWRSKGMKSVVLSTTEAEYMALSEVVKELKFIVQLLQFMNI